jgi:hypothetical protein
VSPSPTAARVAADRVFFTALRRRPPAARNERSVQAANGRGGDLTFEQISPCV